MTRDYFEDVKTEILGENAAIEVFEQLKKTAALKYTDDRKRANKIFYSMKNKLDSQFAGASIKDK